MKIPGYGSLERGGEMKVAAVTATSSTATADVGKLRRLDPTPAPKTTLSGTPKCPIFHSLFIVGWRAASE
jgi:hypothetical protein